MTKLVSSLLTLLVLGSLVGCVQTTTSIDSSLTSVEVVTTSPILHEVPQHIVDEEHASFNFFWETANTMNLGYGLIPDRYPSNTTLSSIASVGFGMSALVIGVENGWITKEQGEERFSKTLTTLESLDHVEGFFYHFYTIYGAPTSSEISNIDSSILFMGLLHAGSYFGGENNQRARALYERANWPWFVDNTRKMFYMAYEPSTKKYHGAWDFYAEQMMMYFLGAGSPTHPISKDLFYTFIRHYGSYKGYSFIHSWFGSLFTYQFTHAWIDFRDIEDNLGVNWFDNSVKASLANHQYAVDNSDGFKTFSTLAWGMTASDTPTGYSGLLGAAPSGYSDDAHKNDGTIAPAGALGSIVFTPELAIASSAYYTEVLGDSLIGKYGYKDAFNNEGDALWVAKDVIGIDKGITLLMIENYRTELLWKQMMQIDYIQNALNVLQFNRSEN